MKDRPEDQRHHCQFVVQVLSSWERKTGVPIAPPGAMMDLTQPLQGGAQQLPPSERRSSPRHPYQRKALCQVRASDKDGSPWLLGTSQDISLTGVGFIFHRRFDPGTL